MPVETKEESIVTIARNKHLDLAIQQIATDFGDGAARPAGADSSAPRSTHAGQKPPGAFTGIGALQVGQSFVFTQIPDGRGARRYGKSFAAGDCGTG